LAYRGSEEAIGVERVGLLKVVKVGVGRYVGDVLMKGEDDDAIHPHPLLFIVPPFSRQNICCLLKSYVHIPANT
jgi:hypothetical protein